MEQELAQFTAIYTQIIAYLVDYSFQIVGAVIVFIVGLFISRRVASLILALCERKNLDITLSRFFASSARLTVIVALGLCSSSGPKSKHCRDGHRFGGQFHGGHGQ